MQRVAGKPERNVATGNQPGCDKGSQQLLVLTCVLVVKVDRYKQLLLKQRDIMIALTGRLNERDEQILTLQEELEAYDAHQK